MIYNTINRSLLFEKLILIYSDETRTEKRKQITEQYKKKILKKL